MKFSQTLDDVMMRCTGTCLLEAQFSLNNVHKRGLKHHHFISFTCLLDERDYMWDTILDSIEY